MASYSQHNDQLKNFLQSHKNSSNDNHYRNFERTTDPSTSHGTNRTTSASKSSTSASKSSTSASKSSRHQETKLEELAAKRKSRMSTPQMSRSDSRPSSVRTADSRPSSVRTDTNTTSGGARPKSKLPNNDTLFASKVGYSRVPKATVDWLPDELLLAIFESLQPTDLLSCARVCKRWHGLASDNLLWRDIYKQHGSRVAKLQKTKKRQEVPKNPPHSFWKSYCVEKGAEFRNNRSLKILKQKKINPFTGLQKGTADALDKAGVRWVLCLVDVDDVEHTVFHSDVFHFNLSTCVRWYSFTLPSVHRIKHLRVYSGNPIMFDADGKSISNSPLQRSLLYERDFKLSQITSSWKPLASDEVINLYSLPDGIILATWKDSKDVAFIAMNFSAYCLVDRCLHGNSSSCWRLPRHRAVKDDIDSRRGLYGYNCTMELRNMRNTIWSEQFMNFNHAGFKDGYAVFDLIDPEKSFQRSWVDKKVQFPWKTEALKGIVKDLCILDVILLDDQGSPMWYPSGLVTLNSTKMEDTYGLTYEYEGDYHNISFADSCGKINMLLIWEAPSKKFFMTGLQLHLAVEFINRWFATGY